MRLRIVKGDFEAEVVSGSLTIEDIRQMLRQMAVAEEKEKTTEIREAGEKTSKEGLTSTSKQVGKLNAKPKLPI